MKALALVLVALAAILVASLLTRWQTRPWWQVAGSVVAIVIAVLWARSGADPVSDGSIVSAVLVGAAIAATFRPKVTGGSTGRSTGPGT